MKTLIFGAIVGAALAAANSVFAQANDAIEVCTSVGELAESIMQHRQSGTSMSLLMSVVTEGLDDDSASRNVVAGMIRSAYGEPRFSTDRMQRRSIEDFRNSYEAMCFANRS